MTDDPLDAMKARWSYIQGFLFPWMREDNDPITEALGRLVTTLDVIGLEAFVPEPPRGPGRPPEDRRALARAFVAKAVLGVPTTSALIERLGVDKSLRRILGWERRSQVPSEATFSRAFAEFARGALPDKIHAALIERALGGRIIGAIARDATEIEGAVEAFAHSPNGGLIVTSSALSVLHRDLIIALAARHKLPAVYYRRYFVTSGGLISYGFDLVDQYRRAAGYVDRILKGERPADLPVQAPTRYELVINMKTARALGLAVPNTVLARADEVIE